MDLYDFFNTFVTAAAGDIELQTWGQLQFGAAVRIFADVESDGLPTAADMPYVLFHSPLGSKRQTGRLNSYGLAADLALTKDALKMRLEDNLAEPAGLELILDMVTLLVEALVEALPENVTLAIDLGADTLGMLPEVHAYLDLTFEETITIGVDPMA